MSIDAADIDVYRAETMDDTSANGGRQSWIEAVSGAPNNLWPPVTNTERLAGFDKYRKHFWRVDDASDQTASNVKIAYKGPTPAEDAIYAFAGTLTNTQGDLTGSERLYGSGDLQEDITAGATTVKVTLEDPTRTIFADGDLILVDDGTNQDWLTVSGAPSLVGSTLTITTSTQVLNSYSTSDTTVSSVIESGNISASISSVVPTTTSGTIDDVQMVAHNTGAEYDQITITFTSATAFNVAGANVGAIGSGVISSDFTPNNPSVARPMFTIPSTAWGGTWAIGETVTFDLNPAAQAIWERRIAAPGAASAPDNKRTLSFWYE